MNGARTYLVSHRIMPFISKRRMLKAQPSLAVHLCGVTIAIGVAFEFGVGAHGGLAHSTYSAMAAAIGMVKAAIIVAAVFVARMGYANMDHANMAHANIALLISNVTISASKHPAALGVIRFSLRAILPVISRASSNRSASICIARIQRHHIRSIR